MSSTHGIEAKINNRVWAAKLIKVIKKDSKTNTNGSFFFRF